MASEELFGDHDISAMNETDVRELIVRPFLHALGYRQGTHANIRTEQKFSYSKAFLGHKNPDKDPELQGRADYICEVISYGRWVVEVKSPKRRLTQEDANQAHTYAAHPEVAGVYSLLTNGREFRLYQTSKPEEPQFSWPVSSTVDNLMMLRNLLGPEAIKAHFSKPLDLGKPLAIGFGSSARIVGGTLSYDRHLSDNALMNSAYQHLSGMRASVIGGKVERDEVGRIVAEIEIAGPYNGWDVANQSLGAAKQSFASADEYISTSVENPSIFQSHLSVSSPAGIKIELPFLGEQTTPFPMQMVVDTEAIGFVENGKFKGTFQNKYDVKVGGGGVRSPRLAGVPSHFDLLGEGTFEVVLG